MSVDEQCQVKCCERHLMCFISVCLNCPGTLESLSVNQIRRNETCLLSSEDTCLSAVTQANAGKKAFQVFWSTRGYMIALRFVSGIAHVGLFHYDSPKGRTEVTLLSTFNLDVRNINYSMMQQSEFCTKRYCFFTSSQLHLISLGDDFAWVSLWYCGDTT